MDDLAANNGDRNKPGLNDRIMPVHSIFKLSLGSRKS